MKKIVSTKFIEAAKNDMYQKNLMNAIDELQSANLEVEVIHSMSQSNKGIGYMYSAIVIGRQI